MQQSRKNEANKRFLENGHILLWLIKDTCWSMSWRAGGMLMILPTLGVAFYILWRSRRQRAELCHNLAICLWIAANTLWMTGEFYSLPVRPFVLSFFITGLAVLFFYYTFLFRADWQKENSKD